MAQDLQEWWDGLHEADQDLFLEHRNTSPLPAEIVTRFVRTGQLIAGVTWVSTGQPYAFDWPSNVQAFLEREYLHRNPQPSGPIGNLPTDLPSASGRPHQ